jgi:hypothetical protein
MPSSSASDFVYALVGWCLLLGAPVLKLFDFGFLAMYNGDPFALVVLVAFPFAVGHWYAGWSVGPLGAMFFRIVAVTLGLGVVVMVLLGTFDAAPTTGSTTAMVLNAVYLTVVYAVAFVWLRRGSLLSAEPESVETDG